MEAMNVSSPALDRRGLRILSRLARGRVFAAGARRGHRVAVVGKSGVALAATVTACVDMGAVAVPVNSSARFAELSHVFADAGVTVVVDGSDDDVARAEVKAAADAVSAVVLSAADIVADIEDVADTEDVEDVAVGEVDDDAPALLIYTSGTTGRQKGCTHTRRTLRGGLLALMHHWAIGADDVVINALPLFHVHGLGVALLGPLWAGAQVRLLDRFSPEGVVAAAADGATVMMCVPTMVHRLVAHLDDHPDDAAALRRLRLVTCGSAPLPATLLSAFEARTGHVILERYGMSETLITLSNPLHGTRVPGAVGGPIDGVEVRVDDGELLVRGPGVMTGYWGRPDADAEVFVGDDADEGRPFLRTGDAVVVGDDGVIRIVGRLSQDIMKVGGEKLSTREIEDAIAAFDEVLEVAVVGSPDPEWGEKVCAAVVLKPGRGLSLADVQARLPLARVKWPRDLMVCDALPRNALGKVMKVALKAQFSTRA
jgi:acyl-CoA synthetase (AMP-forming)/AMP-acid ligase II